MSIKKGKVKIKCELPTEVESIVLDTVVIATQETKNKKSNAQTA